MSDRPSVRGVFRLDCFLSQEGFPLYVAIAADGRRVSERTLYPFENAHDLEDDLWDVLDAEDPPIRRSSAA